MSIFFRSESRDLTPLDVWGQSETPTNLAGGSLSSALDLLPVHAAVRLIVSSLTTLPIHQHRKTSDGGRVHRPLTPALADPHDHMRRAAWLSQGLSSALLRGNAYAYAVSYSGAYPDRVVWLHPDKVAVDESGPRPLYSYNGRPIDDPRRLEHIQGITLPGSVVGVSPIKAAAMAIESGLQAQKMSRDWFRNRAVPSAIFKNTAKTLPPGDAEKISARFKSRIRSGDPLVYGSDWEYQSLKISADDAAFIKSARVSATQVASIFGLPPESIGGESGGSLTYSTVEQNTLNLITIGLRPWMVIFEEALGGFLTPADEQIRFKPDAMIRTDTKTRNEVYRIRRELGMNSIDELRALDDEEPLPDGQGASYTPLRLTQSTANQEESK